MSAFRNFLITFLVGLVIFGLLGFGLSRFVSNTFFPDGENGNDSPSDNVETEASETKSPGEELSGMKGESFTALFLVSDYQPDVYTDYEISDETDENGFPKEKRKIKTPVLVLEHVNKETGECIFCGIPGNMQTTVDGVACKIEELYELKGIDAVCQRVLAMTGIPVDYYSIIEPANLTKMIDELGGISYYVNTTVDYKPAGSDTSIHIGRGAQKLDGNQVTALLLCNNYSDMYGKQKEVATSFIHEFLKKCISDAQSDKGNAEAKFEEFAKYIQTNFTSEDFKREKEIIFAFSKFDVSEYKYPGTSSGKGINSHFTPNVNAGAEYFLKFKFQG